MNKSMAMDPLYVPYPIPSKKVLDMTVDESAKSVTISQPSTSQSQPGEMRRRAGQLQVDGSDRDAVSKDSEYRSIESDEIIADEKFYRIFSIVICSLALFVLLCLALALMLTPPPR